MRWVVAQICGREGSRHCYAAGLQSLGIVELRLRKLREGEKLLFLSVTNRRLWLWVKTAPAGFVTDPLLLWIRCTMSRRVRNADSRDEQVRLPCGFLLLQLEHSLDLNE